MLPLLEKVTVLPQLFIIQLSKNQGHNFTLKNIVFSAVIFI